MEERVRVEMEDGIADVRMVRADKLNAMDMPMFAALVDTGLELAADRSLRAVVLSGEGRAFSAGLDVPAVMSGIGARPSGPRLFDPSPGSPANHAQRAAWVWQEVGLKPIPPRFSPVRPREAPPFKAG